MPLTTIPEDFTPRVWLNYNDGNNDHSLMLRYNRDDSDPGIVVGVLVDFLVAIEPVIYAVSILGVEGAVEETNVRNPLTWTGDGAYGTGAQPGADAPKQLLWQGKDPEGHRWRASMFGLKLGTPNTYRYNQGDNSDIDAARAVFGQAFTDNKICTINLRKALLVLWTSFNYNNHWGVGARG